VGAALLGHQEPCPGDDRLGPCVQALGGVRDCGDSSSREDRIVVAEGGPDLRQKLEGRRGAAHVSAGLEALCDHGVGARALGGQRLPDGPDLVDPDPRGAAAGPAPERDQDVRLLGDLEVRRLREWEQQVHRERPIGEPARRGELVPEPIRHEYPDRAETAGLRDRRSEGGTGEPAAHTGLHDRQLDSESLQEDPHGSSIPRRELNWPASQDL
jgi:hypothetical protein